MKTLKQFILESQVLGLYRNFLKITPRHYTEVVSQNCYSVTLGVQGPGQRRVRNEPRCRPITGSVPTWSGDTEILDDEEVG